MAELEKICKFFERDRFAMGMGTVIEEVEPGRAVCSLVPEDKHLNAGDAVQGGVVFTLADFAFALATNCGGELVVSLDNNISFIASPKGKITATATVYKETGKLAFCDVVVYDERDVLVAKMSVTGYKKGVSLPIE